MSISTGRKVSGIMLAISVHIFVIFLLRHQISPFPTKPDRSSALTVNLRPVPNDFSVPAPGPGQQASTSERPKSHVPPDTSRPRSESRNTSRHTTPDAPQPLTDAARKKTIDIDGIYLSLGKITGDIDRENSNSPLGQLQTQQRDALRTETALSRNVARAGRDDCLAPNSLPGGLLAPIYLLMDKKGAGCKFQ